MHCKKWTNTSGLTAHSNFQFGHNSLNANQHLIIDNLHYDGITEGGNGNYGILMNCTGGTNPIVTNSSFRIDIKNLEIGSSGPDGDLFSLCSLYRLEMDSSEIIINIDNFDLNCKLLTGGVNFDMTDSKVLFNVSGITTTTLSPVLTLDGDRINSVIKFTGTVRHTQNVPFVTSASTDEGIFFDNFNLDTEGFLGEFSSNIHAYNSKFIVDGSSDLIDASSQISLINAGSVTNNTLTTIPNVTVVGEPLVKNTMFK